MTKTLLSEGLPEGPPAPAACSFEDLLVKTPLAAERRVIDARDPQWSYRVEWPESIRAYCPTPKTCEGVRRHSRIKAELVGGYFFGNYGCVDCDNAGRINFILRLTGHSPGVEHADFEKIYQRPAFGAPIPPDFFSLIGENNRAHFLQARRSAARGLGIGAYAYYRRIIEDTKLNLVNSVLKVAKTTRAPANQIKLLEVAAKETQFTRAIEILNDINAIPPVLLIEGQNPLKLLHGELSVGIHELSDAECLARAQHAELILFELARLMKLALTEQDGLKQALSSINSRNAGAKT